MKQTTIESNQSDESIVSKISEQVKDTPTRVAEEISNITGATATVINARTIQIDNNGTINISTAKADEFNATEIRKHPSIGWATPHNEHGKVGISVDIRTPNAESWEAQKIDNRTKHTIPSGKTVFKIISESDVDFDISNNGVRVKGTIEQVNKVIDRIAGNPLSDW